MRMTDEDKYRTVEVNRHYFRVYFGRKLVGAVRHGLDSYWYPELVATKGRGAAVQTVILANEAVTEFERCSGNSPAQ